MGWLTTRIRATRWLAMPVSKGGLNVPARGRDDQRKRCRLFVARRWYFANQNWPATDSVLFVDGSGHRAVTGIG